jgi:hypothetical protein
MKRPVQPTEEPLFSDPEQETVALVRAPRPVRDPFRAPDPEAEGQFTIGAEHDSQTAA